MSMDDSSPRLEVGFVIDTGDSFGGLTQLQAAMDSTEAKVLAELSASPWRLGSVRQQWCFGAGIRRRPPQPPGC
jgi:hypothetical protein